MRRSKLKPTWQRNIDRRTARFKREGITVQPPATYARMHEHWSAIGLEGVERLAMEMMNIGDTDRRVLMFVLLANGMLFGTSVEKMYAKLLLTALREDERVRARIAILGKNVKALQAQFEGATA
jgi:hypothetical protein